MSSTKDLYAHIQHAIANTRHPRPTSLTINPTPTYNENSDERTRAQIDLHAQINWRNNAFNKIKVTLTNKHLGYDKSSQLSKAPVEEAVKLFGGTGSWKASYKGPERDHFIVHERNEGDDFVWLSPLTGQEKLLDIIYGSHSKKPTFEDEPTNTKRFAAPQVTHQVQSQIYDALREEEIEFFLQSNSPYGNQQYHLHHTPTEFTQTIIKQTSNQWLRRGLHEKDIKPIQDFLEKHNYTFN